MKNNLHLVMRQQSQQPIIILGGFLISEDSYIPMAKWLENEISQPVKIIKVSKLDWLLTNWTYGWKRILDRVNAVVKELSYLSTTNKVTLIGHSSGGIMLRLFLSDYQLGGITYNGRNSANKLITLGTPHQAKRATYLRKLVDEIYPGNFYSSSVDYISFAGELNLNSEYASKFARRFAIKSYKSLMAKDLNSGDGLVPIESSLLQGSKSFILKNTSHSKLFGKEWYASLNKTKEWWDLSNKL